MKTSNPCRHGLTDVKTAMAELAQSCGYSAQVVFAICDTTRRKSWQYGSRSLCNQVILIALQSHNFELWRWLKKIENLFILFAACQPHAIAHYSGTDVLFL